MTHQSKKVSCWLKSLSFQKKYHRSSGSSNNSSQLTVNLRGKGGRWTFRFIDEMGHTDCRPQKHKEYTCMLVHLCVDSVRWIHSICLRLIFILLACGHVLRNNLLALSVPQSPVGWIHTSWGGFSSGGQEKVTVFPPIVLEEIEFTNCLCWGKPILHKQVIR